MLLKNRRGGGWAIAGSLALLIFVIGISFNKKTLVVNTGRALEYLTKGKYKATNHRVLWNKTKRMSIPFFFEPSYDFKMSTSFLNASKIYKNGLIYEKFLKKSLKKFVEYKR